MSHSSRRPFGWSRASIVALVLATAPLALPASASAATFTLQSYDVTLRDYDPGLVLWSKDGLTQPWTFDLNYVGDSVTRKLFTIGTNEDSMNWDDALIFPIAVDFAFSAPSAISGVAEGITGALFVGYVAWDNPLLLNFGSGGVLSVSLSNAVFGLPGKADIDATFKLLKEGGAVQVSEPATGLLLGVGFLTAIIRRRVRQ